jgi:hypothetical protein
MKLERLLLLGAVQKSPTGEVTAARDDIKTLGMLRSNSPLPLRGCVLLAELTCAATDPESQQLRITMNGPRGAVVLGDSAIGFGPPSNGIRAARVAAPLDAFAFPQVGTYIFSLDSNSAPVGELQLPMAMAGGRAKARFSAFLQDQHGVSGTERYLAARLPFALFDGNDAFCGYHMAHIRQRDGDNFEIDALDLTLAPGGEGLSDAYDFKVAVHKAYEIYARQMFGGRMPTGSSINMGHNLLQGDQVVEFDLPSRDAAQGW